ncbi:hypothetical protein GCM10027418_31680 [Mariniluteicoccus endophyticus]
MTTLIRTLAAELVATRRTFGGLLWVLGLLVAFLQCSGWLLIATRDLQSWTALLAWESMYATGLAGGLAGLVGALAVTRERSTRSAGTPSRSPGQGITHVSRLLVLAGELALFTAALTLPMLPFGVAMGLPGVPVGRLAALTVVLWVGALPWLALGVLVARRLGLYAAVAVTFIGHVAGTIRAEHATWWAEPWTWGVRAALPLLHTHANGVPAQPGEAVLSLPVTTLSLMTGAAALVVAVLAVAVPARTPRPRRSETAHAGPAAPLVVDAPVRRGRPRTVVAALSVLRTWWVWAIPVGALLLITVTRLLWRPTYVHGLMALVVIPGMTCLLACLTTLAHRDGLRVALTRVSAWRWCAAQTLVLGFLIVPLVVWGALLSGHAGSVLVVGATSALALLLVDLWLATHFGIGVALGVTFVGLVWSVTLGGSQLAEGPVLWLLGPWVYAYSATGGDRMLVAAGLSLLVVPVAAYLWTRSVRRAAALS